MVEIIILEHPKVVLHVRESSPAIYTSAIYGTTKAYIISWPSGFYTGLNMFLIF